MNKSSHKRIRFTAVAVSIAAILGVLVLTFLIFMRSGSPYDDIINEYSKEFGVDKQLIKSIISAESGFDPNVVSEKGAVGLMQILPSTAEFMAERLHIKIDDLALPRTNILIGTAYVKYLCGRFSSEKAVIAAYNAGEGRVAEWLRNPDYSSDGVQLKAIPFKETAIYVRRVLKYKRLFSGCARISA